MPRLRILVAALLLAAPAAAQNQWKFAVSPYLWLPTFNGNLNEPLPPQSGDGIFQVEIGPNDYLKNLKFALLLNGEARKDRYSVLSDVVYLNTSGQRSNIRTIDFAGDRLPVEAAVNSDTTTGFKGVVWTVAGGYALDSDPDSLVDLIAGVRYLGIDTRADWQLTTTVTGPNGDHTFPSSGRTAKRVDLFDGIVGVRGRARVGNRWHIPYAVDVGAGDSKFTWEAMTGVTYAFGWGDVGAVYRHLSVQQKQPGVVESLSLSGPAVTFTFRF